MKAGRLADVLDWLKPGARVFLQGSTGEILPLIDLFRDAPERLAGVDLWSNLVPGVNAFDYGALHAGNRLTTFMASPALATSLADGRTRLLSLPYSAMADILAQTSFDLAIVQASPPDAAGVCSFGVACDTPALVMPNAAKVIAVINPGMPRMPRAPGLRLDDADLAVEVDAPLVSAPQTVLTPGLEQLGRLAAGLVPDGAAIQSGIGQAPAAVLRALCDHRRLRIFSGLVTPEYRPLFEAGALAPGAEHVTGIAVGDADFYAWLAKCDLARFADARETHGAASLAAIPGFVSINTAIEIDLSGQINIEWRGETRISSVGGAPDYMAGAAASSDGLSIIALPATARAGASRIVPRLHPSRVSIGGDLTDAVVTEHGVARLRGLAGNARAKALIAIADPAHRDRLAKEWLSLDG
jgi:acyl-CoA hydrolase